MAARASCEPRQTSVRQARATSRSRTQTASSSRSSTPTTCGCRRTSSARSPPTTSMRLGLASRSASSRATRVSAGPAETWPWSYLDSLRPPVHEITLERLVYRNCVFISTLVARDAGEEVGWFEPSLFGTEDHDLWIRILETGRRAVLNREVLVIYRHTPGSVSSNLARMAVNCQGTYGRALDRGRLPTAAARTARRELHVLPRDGGDRASVVRPRPARRVARGADAHVGRGDAAWALARVGRRAAARPRLKSRQARAGERARRSARRHRRLDEFLEAFGVHGTARDLTRARATPCSAAARAAAARGTSPTAGRASDARKVISRSTVSRRTVSALTISAMRSAAGRAEPLHDHRRVGVGSRARRPSTRRTSRARTACARRGAAHRRRGGSPSGARRRTADRR